MDIKEIFIKDNFIKLDSALKFANIVSSGGQAKILILDGKVKVNGEICLQRGKKLYKNDIFSFEKESYIIKNDN